MLGDTYVFHFATAEWARLDAESDTDPRFGHAGSTVDGALVLLHGRREAGGGGRQAGVERDAGRDTGVCIAINLETYLMFPMEERSEGADRESAYAFSAYEHGLRATEQGAQGAGVNLHGGAGGRAEEPGAVGLGRYCPPRHRNARFLTSYDVSSNICQALRCGV